MDESPKLEELLDQLRGLSDKYGVQCTNLAMDYVNYVTAGLRSYVALDFIKYNLEMGDRYR